MTGSGFKVCNTVKLCESVSVSTLFEQAKNLSQDWVWKLPGLLFISGCHCTDFFTEMIGVKIGHALSHITVSQLATLCARQCMLVCVRVCISTSPWLHSYCQEVQGCSSFLKKKKLKVKRKSKDQCHWISLSLTVKILSWELLKGVFIFASSCVYVKRVGSRDWICQSWKTRTKMACCDLLWSTTRAQIH